MGVEEEDEDDVDDVDNAEAAAELDPWDAAWLDSLKEAGPLQKALVKVNKLRIEVDTADEKIAANEGGAAYFASFLQKNRDRKKADLASSEKELDDLQSQADHSRRRSLRPRRPPRSHRRGRIFW